MAWRQNIIAVVAIGTFGLANTPLRAAELDEATCATLHNQHQESLKTDVSANRARGPEWAKQNLTKEQLNEIGALIRLEEQLSFQCAERLTARPTMLREPDADPPLAPDTAAKTDATAKPEGAPSNALDATPETKPKTKKALNKKPHKTKTSAQ